MSKDRINDLITTPVINQVDVSPVLGCQDRYELADWTDPTSQPPALHLLTVLDHARYIRVLDSNKLHFEAFVDGAVLSLDKYVAFTIASSTGSERLTLCIFQV